VCIVTDFQTATREASNALLKTLEEPPARAVLILTARDASLLLPTIVSRCQVLALRAVPSQTIASALTSDWQLAPAASERIARLAAGRVGWALSAAQDDEVVSARSEHVKQLVSLVGQGEADRIQYAERLSKAAALEPLAHIWQTWWRDVMLACAGCDQLVVNRDLLESVQAVAQQTNLESAQQASRASIELLDQLEQNVNARLALEVLFLGWPQTQPLALAGAGSRVAST
jgi:DNA polymerase-3 subunit delta'